MAFFCSECHGHVCPYGDHGRFRSRGACEVCGRQSNCVDCHRHDIRRMRAKDRAYVTAKRGLRR